jgi:hydroxymethylbilane synthase
MRRLRLGTRGSALALVQARHVAALLRQRGSFEPEIVEIKTAGDRLVDVPLASVGGKGLFVKELEEALLAGMIDIAVHSSKDMPATLAAGLAVVAALPREDPSDAFVLRLGTPASSFADALRALGTSPAIGTSSVRRIAQLAALIPGARFQPLRGNVDTRLRKLDDGQADAVVLAAAGLRRLGLDHRISTLVPVDLCIPSPGQGTVAVEARAADHAVREALGELDDAVSAACLRAERAVVSRLGGGCQMPIGALATITADQLWLRCVVVTPDGSRAVRAEARGHMTGAIELGTEAADRLLAAGASEILDALRSNGAADIHHT